MLQFLNKEKQMNQDYFKPRAEGEINLVEEVRNILIENGFGQKISSFDSNRMVTDAYDKCSSVQRFQLNRYFSIQLIMAVKDSTEQRFCLIPNGEVNDWLILFKSKIVPFMIEEDLLRPL
jgi:hypothetical protein